MKDINNWEEKFEACLYSDRLVRKLIDLNERTSDKVNINEVKKAIYYARKYHGSQMRQSGEPYYSHPLEVAFLLAEYAGNENHLIYRTDLMITAILHDTIEDTALTKEMIEKLFGRKIANNVEDLTRVKLDIKISAGESLNILFTQYKKDILYIKLFDRLHNVRTISYMKPEKIKKIIYETIGFFIPLTSYLNILGLEEELAILCAKANHSNKPISLEIFSSSLPPTFQNEIDLFHTLKSRVI